MTFNLINLIYLINLEGKVAGTGTSKMLKSLI